MKTSIKVILLRDESINNKQNIVAMFEFKILKNISRKRTSTNAIKEDEESRKKVCETIKKEITDDNVTKDETVERELFMYRQEAKRRIEEKKRFIERKSRQRI